MDSTLSYATGPLESRSDYKDNPEGQYKYWQVELSASERNLKAFIKQGNAIVKRYLAKPLGASDSSGSTEELFLLNLFYANTTTLESTLYGSVPTVDVSRRYADSNDDVGRVGAVLMERLLNNDIADDGREVECVLRSCLNDRLVVGLGVSRIRYTAEFGADTTTLVKEDAVTEYVHWQDVRWGWARSFAEVPWIAFRAYMTKDEATERFGKDKAKNLTYKVQQPVEEDKGGANTDNSSPWMKTEVWEIWEKKKRQVIWWSMGCSGVLDTKDDPLQLSNFYPCPPFFIANATSTLYIPTADFHLAQDLYNEVDKLQTRIAIITEAVKVVGVYDSTNGEIARMMKEGTDNDLIPVENWAMFAEKGGIQGQIDWFPIGDVVNSLVQLIQMRDQTIGLLQQITGMSDIMQGQLANQYEGVGQSQMKAQFGSIRIQALQDQFAKYATDLMQIKAEVISKHFSPETILQRANARHLPEVDHELVLPAVELLKDTEKAKLCINIRPESVAMVDYAALKNERTEFITALATFMQSAAPLVEMEPDAQPMLLKLLQWGLSGFKGSSEIEGVIDNAIEMAEEKLKKTKEQPPEPSPEEKMQQAEQQFQMQIEQFKAQAEMQKIQAKAQADMAVRKADMDADVQTTLMEHGMQTEAQQAELMATLAEIQAKLTADVEKERAQAEMNIMQTQAQAQAEIGKDVVEAELDVATEAQKTSLKIDEIGANAKAKMAENTVKTAQEIGAKKEEIKMMPKEKPEAKKDD